MFFVSFEADGGGDFTREHFLYFFALVSLETHDAADSLFRAGRRVVYVRTGGECAGIHAEEGERADERISLEFEGERAERLIVICMTLHRLAGLRVRARHWLQVERGREVVDDSIEHELDALILERAAAVHWENLIIDDGFA